MSDLYDLPNGWEWKKLGDLAKFQSGGTPKRSNKSYWNGDINWVKISDITNSMYVSKTEEFITKDGLDNSSAKLFQKGTILYTIFATIGKIGILDIEATTNQAISGIQPKENVDLLYMYYGLKFITNEVKKVSAGVAQNNINLTKLKEQWFPLPQLSEQQRIVSKLDNLFEKIDKSIALHQKNMDEADAFMGSVLNDVFGELEENYQPTKLKDIVTKEKTSIKRGPFGSALKKSFFVESGYLVYEQFHALNNDFSMERYFIDEDKFNELKGFKVKAGDIIISCSGVYLGKLAIIPNDYTKGIINQALLKLTLDKNIIIDKMFVYFWNNLINNGFFNEVKKGAAIPNMPSVKQLKEIDIPLPSIQTQQKTVKYLDEVSQKLEKVKQVQKEKMDSLKALKASILDRAFRGEL